MYLIETAAAAAADTEACMLNNQAYRNVMYMYYANNDWHRGQ